MSDSYNPVPNEGEVPAPQVGGNVDGPIEDALIGDPSDVEPNADEPLREDNEVIQYFASVTDTEARNYIMFLHDLHAISAERKNELFVLLDNNPSLFS